MPKGMRVKPKAARTCSMLIGPPPCLAGVEGGLLYEANLGAADLMEAN